MESIQPALDPRKQELLEARFLGARVSLQPKNFFSVLKISGLHPTMFEYVM